MVCILTDKFPSTIKRSQSEENKLIKHPLTIKPAVEMLNSKQSSKHHKLLLRGYLWPIEDLQMGGNISFCLFFYFDKNKLDTQACGF